MSDILREKDERKTDLDSLIVLLKDALIQIKKDHVRGLIKLPVETLGLVDGALANYTRKMIEERQRGLVRRTG